MARPPQPDSFAGASSWAPLSPDVDRDAAPQAGQLPLFDTPRTPAPARPARLRGRLQALLARAAERAGEASREPPASWPDSVFDVEPRP